MYTVGIVEIVKKFYDGTIKVLYFAYGTGICD